jgi:hypothetical protein
MDSYIVPTLYSVLNNVYDVFKQSLILYIEQQASQSIFQAAADPINYLLAKILKETLDILQSDFDEFIEQNSAIISFGVFRIFTNVKKETLYGFIPDKFFTDYKSIFTTVIIIFQNYLGKPNIREMLKKYEGDTMFKHYALLQRDVTFNRDINEKITNFVSILIPVLQRYQIETREKMLMDCKFDGIEKEKIERELINKEKEELKLDESVWHNHKTWRTTNTGKHGDDPSLTWKVTIPESETISSSKHIFELCKTNKSSAAKLYYLYSLIIVILNTIISWNDQRKYYMFCFIFYCFKTKYNLNFELDTIKGGYKTIRNRQNKMHNRKTRKR